MKSWLEDPRKRAIGISLIVSVLMLSGKWVAYLITGSSAILSDAVESVVHIAATGIAAFGVWYGSRPADPDHPYGHGKIAYFSAGFEGALLFAAAIPIVAEAIFSLARGPELQRLNLGILITFGLGVLNLALGLYLVHEGRKHRSIALIANGKHVLTDMWTSVGVVGGILLVKATGLLWLDPIVAIAVSLWIFWTGLTLIYRSYHGLMDRADPKTSRLIQEQLNKSVQEGLLADFHQLRHREVDSQIWVEVHFLLPGGLTLTEAHGKVTQVEEQLRTSFPRHKVIISSHLEPDDHQAAHPHGHAADDPLTG